MDKQILLGVNIDHVASLRQSRLTRYPDPVYAAGLAEQAGADSITIHLREDRRHIQERDLQILTQTVQTRINLEMAVTDDMVAIAKKYKPADCCLVPERREELTTEGGLDVSAMYDRVAKACRQLSEAGIRVSLFIDPMREQIELAAKLGAPAIELHTGHYANQIESEQQSEILHTIINSAKYATELGLQVNAGHGLHYHNVQAISAIKEIRELNIGHAIVARSIYEGLPKAVREMKRLMVEARMLLID